LQCVTEANEGLQLLENFCVSSGIWHKRSIKTLFLSPCTRLSSDFWPHCASHRYCDESVPGTINTINTSTATDFCTGSFYWSWHCHTSHLINLCHVQHILCILCIFVFVKCKGKAKAVPLQACSGPEGSRELRFPDFMTTAQDGGKVVSLTHRPPLPPGNTPGTHFW
jgi:hypothetical protein